MTTDKLGMHPSSLTLSPIGVIIIFLGNSPEKARMAHIPGNRIYADYINGGPLLPEVAAAMIQAVAAVGNPSSPHAEGRRAAQAMEKARGQVAGLLGALAEEIHFTSSGTEANAWALLGLTQPQGSAGRHLVLSAIEHLSVLQAARRMEREGWKVTVVPVDRSGRSDPAEIENAITPETALVSIQWANAEVGTIQPIAEIARRVKRRGILFHSDAVAAVGSIPVDVGAVPVDALSLAASAFGGPPGIGALFVRKGVRIDPLFVGGAQEEGRRAGTENLPGIVGMGKAAEMAKRGLLEAGERLTSLRDRLIQGVLSRVPQAVLNGHPVERLPGHVSVSFPGAEAESLVLALDLEGIAAGVGSACSSRTMKVSHVLKAMGAERSCALGTITLTLGVRTTEAEIAQALEILPRAVERQRGQTPSGAKGAGSDFIRSLTS